MESRMTLFTTEDAERARGAIGQVFLRGAVPYVAVRARLVWEVVGEPRDPHPHPDAPGR